MEVTFNSLGGGFPAPMGPHTGPGKTRILLIDDDKKELDALAKALAANHRLITPVQARDVKTAMESFSGHDIVVVDRDLSPQPGWEGVEITAKIKQLNPSTLVIVNSAFPPPLFGKSDCGADYTHTKGLGGICARGEHKSLLDVKNPCKGYENLSELINKIEREKLKQKQ